MRKELTSWVNITGEHETRIPEYILPCIHHWHVVLFYDSLLANWLKW